MEPNDAAARFPAQEAAMTQHEDGKLDADDFPIAAERTKLKTQDGVTIAEAKSKQLADCIAERLNAHAHQEEEDRWSA